MFELSRFSQFGLLCLVSLILMSFSSFPVGLEGREDGRGELSPKERRLEKKQHRLKKRLNNVKNVNKSARLKHKLEKASNVPLRRVKVFSTLGLVFGALSFFFGFLVLFISLRWGLAPMFGWTLTPLASLFGILGLIFGIWGHVLAKRQRETAGESVQSLIGIILAAIVVGAFLTMLLLGLVVLAVGL